MKLTTCPLWLCFFPHCFQLIWSCSQAWPNLCFCQVLPLRWRCRSVTWWIVSTWAKLWWRCMSTTPGLTQPSPGKMVVSCFMLLTNLDCLSPLWPAEMAIFAHCCLVKPAECQVRRPVGVCRQIGLSVIQPFLRQSCSGGTNHFTGCNKGTQWSLGSLVALWCTVGKPDPCFVLRGQQI